jgi:membrane-associated phospholipid phosphatase
MATQKETAPPDGHYKLYLGAFVTALATFALAASMALSDRPTGWEYSFFMAINGWSEGWYRLFTIVTFFGSTWIALISVVGLFTAKLYRLAWRLAVTIIGAYGVAFLAKHFIGRERPLELFSGVHARIAESGMGFPSGHATVSTVIALTLWPYLPKRARYIVVPLFIGVVCLSRLYLGVHIPLDLIGGVAVGIASVSFIRILPAALRHKLRLN